MQVWHTRTHSRVFWIMGGSEGHEWGSDLHAGWKHCHNKSDVGTIAWSLTCAICDRFACNL